MIFKATTDSEGKAGLGVSNVFGRWAKDFDEATASILDFEQTLDKDIGVLKNYVGILSTSNYTTQDLEQALEEASDNAREFAQNNVVNNESIQQYVISQRQARDATVATTASQKLQTLKTKALTAATKACAFALNLGVMALATWAGTKVLGWLDNVINHEKKVAEAAEEATEAIQTLKAEFDNLSSTTNSTKKRFAELAQGVNQLNGQNLTLSAEDYEEFLETSNQLAELFPELVKGYDSNGNAILDLSGDVDTIVASLDNLVKKQAELAHTEIRSEFTDAFAGYSQNVKKYIGQLEDAQAFQQGLFNFRDGEVSESTQVDGAHVISFDVDPEYSTDIRAELSKLLTDIGLDYNDFVIDSIDTDTLQVQLMKGIYNEETQRLIQEKVGNYASILQEEIDKANKGIDSENLAISESALPYLTTSSDYLNVNSVNLQLAMQQIVKDTDWSQYGKDAAIVYIDTIISSIKNASPQVRVAISELFGNPDLTVSQQQSYLDEIYKYYESNGLEVPVTFVEQQDALNAFRQRMNANFSKIAFEGVGVDPHEFNKLVEFSKDFTEQEFAAWLRVTQGINDADEAIQAYLDSLKETVKATKVLSYVDIVSGVESLSEGLDQLDKVYADVLNGEDFDYSSILNNETFTETFGQYRKEYNEFIQTVTNFPNDISATQTAFDKLVTAYINASGAVDNVTEETKESTIAMLEQMGIANANEVVTRKLAVAKQVARYESSELTKCTVDEIYVLYEEAEAGSIAQQALAQFAFEKALAEGIFLDENANIEQLYNLAQAAGASAKTMADLAEVMWLVSEAQARGGRYNLETGKFEAGFDSSWWSAEQEALVQSFNDYTYEPTFTLSTDNFKFEYEGGSASKSAKEAASDATDEWKEAFEKELAELQHSLEMNYISEADYYTQLNILNEKYFGGREEYLDEYRQYEEEVYKGLLDVYKTYLDAQIALLNAKLDNGTLSYQEYVDKLKKLLDDFYASGKIQAEDYYSYLDNLYSKQLDIYDRVKTHVANFIEDQIDDLEAQKDSIEQTYTLQIEALEKEKEALEKANEARQDAIDLQKKLYELNRAQYQRDNFVYTSDKGFIYRPDESGIRDAQNDLDDAEYENKIKEIDNQISILEQTMESATDGIDDQIDALNEYAEQWEAVSDIYDDAINEIYTAELLGQNWEEEVMNMRQQILTDFTNNYVALHQAQADAAVQAANKIVEANNNIANSQMTDPTTIANTADTPAPVPTPTNTNTSNGTSSKPSGTKKKTSVNNVAQKGGYLAVDHANKKVTDTVFATSAAAWDYLTKLFGTDRARQSYKVIGFANGGVLGKDKNLLDTIAKAIGEDHLVGMKEGERALTVEQNENFEKLVGVAEHFKPLQQGDFPFLDAFFNNMDKFDSSVLNNSNLLTNNVKQNNISDAYGVNNNAPIINIQNPVFTCTGVTGEQVLREIQGQFEGLFINAYQKAMKR